MGFCYLHISKCTVNKYNHAYGLRFAAQSVQVYVQRALHDESERDQRMQKNQTMDCDDYFRGFGKY